MWMLFRAPKTIDFDPLLSAGPLTQQPWINKLRLRSLRCIDKKPVATLIQTESATPMPRKLCMAEVKPVKQVAQRPSARNQTPSDEDVAVSKLPNKGSRSVVCTTKKEGRATYEVANIHCQNNTDSIQTVFLNIVATGYSRIPTQWNSYLFAVGESKRVARLKVVSRPTEVRLDFRAVPFRTITPGRWPRQHSLLALSASQLG